MLPSVHGKGESQRVNCHSANKWEEQGLGNKSNSKDDILLMYVNACVCIY